jgi:hypothetical protein
MRRGIAFLGLLWLCLLPSVGATFAAGHPERGSVTLLDAASGRQLAHLTANGAVVTAIADGRGGWFVAGSFTRLGGLSRVALAHLLPSGSVDPAWRASVGSASGRPVAIYSLARAGDRLFVAGPFGRVGDLQRPGLAALDARNGAVLSSWAAPPPAWIDVQALLVAGPRLLVAGQFGYPTPGIAALDVRTGAVDRGWNPHLRLIGDAGSFNTLLLHGGRVYVAGSFHVAGLDRDGLVALAVGSGQPDRRFAPRVPSCSVCNHFAVVYGLAASSRRLYVTGAFARIRDVARNGVAALDPRTGAVDGGWRPGRGSQQIFRLALVGSRLYLERPLDARRLDRRTPASPPC